MSGLSPGTLHVVLTGERDKALVLSDAAHRILRQQNVEAYAPSGAPAAAGHTGRELAHIGVELCAHAMLQLLC